MSSALVLVAEICSCTTPWKNEMEHHGGLNCQTFIFDSQMTVLEEPMNK